MKVVTIDIGEYILGSDVTPDDFKTKVIELVSKHDGTVLGVIKWYGAWRQYCFFSEGDCLFNNTCLKDIYEYMSELNKEKRNENKKC